MALATTEQLRTLPAMMVPERILLARTTVQPMTERVRTQQERKQRTIHQATTPPMMAGQTTQRKRPLLRMMAGLTRKQPARMISRKISRTTPVKTEQTPPMMPTMAMGSTDWIAWSWTGWMMAMRRQSLPR